MIKSRWDKAFFFFILFLASLLIVNSVLSLHWKNEHDLPLLLYEGFLIDQYDAVPYQDIFEMNMPGTLFFYYIIGKLSHYTDFGIRIIDLIYLLSILFSTAFFLRSFGWKIASLAPFIFGLNYLARGPIDTLQREFLLILPLIWILILLTDPLVSNTKISSFLIGILLGIAFLVKPQMISFWVAVLLFYFVKNKENYTEKFKIKKFSFFMLGNLAGFLIPCLITFFYLWKKNVLGVFLGIFFNYLPLYGGLSGPHETLFGLTLIHIRIIGLQFLGQNGWLCAAAALGLYKAFLFTKNQTNEQKQKILLIAIFTFFSLVHPIIAGHFWFYHWFFFVYFLTILASFCFLPEDLFSFRAHSLLLGIFFFALFFNTNGLIDNFISRLGLHYRVLPSLPRAEEISTFLKANLKPGEKVQPLDWTNGGIYALLLAKAPLATSFIYEFHFYHHISNPYIQHLRKRFIRELKVAQPRYIIDMGNRAKEENRWVSGKDTTNKFPELEDFLQKEYCISQKMEDYTIYEKCQK